MASILRSATQLAQHLRARVRGRNAIAHPCHTLASAVENGTRTRCTSRTRGGRFERATRGGRTWEMNMEASRAQLEKGLLANHLIGWLNKDLALAQIYLL